MNPNLKVFNGIKKMLSQSESKWLMIELQIMLFKYR